MKAGRSQTPVLGLERLAAVVIALQALVGSTCAWSALDVQDDIERILRSRGEDDARTENEVVQELADLGDGAIGALFELATGASGDALFQRGPAVEDWWRRSPDRFGELAQRALGHAHPRRVVEYLQRQCSANPDLLLRRSVFGVLEELRSARSLPLLISLASAFEGAELRYQSIRGPLLDALHATLTGDPAAIEELPDYLRGIDDELLLVVVEALGRSACSGANELLLGLLGRTNELDLAILHAVGQVSEGYPWRLRADPGPALRKLAGSAEWEVRRAALIALGHTGDPASFQALVDALADPNKRVGRAAHWALAKVAGTDTPRSAEKWLKWYDQRQAVWTADRATIDGHLADLEITEAMDVIRRNGLRTLFRHEAAALITQLLEHTEPSVVKAACDVLATIGSRHAVPALVEHLRSRNEAVRAAAWRTLGVLTGEDLPPTPDPWETYLES